MRVKTVRPHRNDHENDQGKPGWKHTGTEYEHPDPAEDIKRGLIEPIGEVASEEEALATEDQPAANGSGKAQTPAKAGRAPPSGRAAARRRRGRRAMVTS